MAGQKTLPFLSALFSGQLPVYAAGVQIGMASSPTALCAGSITLTDPDNTPDPQTWVLPAPWGGDLFADVPVSNWCVTSGIVPAWASNSGGKVSYQLPNGATVQASPNVQGTFSLETVNTNWWLIGGVAVAGVTLIALLRR